MKIYFACRKSHEAGFSTAVIKYKRKSSNPHEYGFSFFPFVYGYLLIASLSCANNAMLQCENAKIKKGVYYMVNAFETFPHLLARCKSARHIPQQDVLRSNGHTDIAAGGQPE